MDKQELLKQLKEASPEKLRTNAILELKAFFVAHLLGNSDIRHDTPAKVLELAEQYATLLHDERMEKLGPTPKAA